MNVYLHSFKFRSPFQTIIDDEIVLDTTKQSFDLVKGLNRTVQFDIKPMITQCCIHKLYLSKDQRAIDLAKTFERRKCNHKDPIDPLDCINSIVNIDGVNKHRYLVASNNYELRKKLRKIPGVPMVFMNRSVMVMEPLSEASKKFSENVESAKLTGGLNDIHYGKTKDEEENEGENEEKTESQEPPVLRKRKGPKGPNPLSMKKKKVQTDQQPKTQKKSRRRKHGKSDDGNNSQPSQSTYNEPSKENDTIAPDVLHETSE
jgi:U3 small nucleolar RNA-associated protein 23